MLKDILSKLATNDFQNRGGRRPVSNIPVTIEAYEDSLDFSFKNTTEDDAMDFVKRYLIDKVPYSMKITQASQEGDYTNDWVNVYVTKD